MHLHITEILSESREFVIRYSQGFITQKDFKKLTKKLSEKELMELMAKVSLNV